ncbi:MAG: hypothetical protein P4M14_02125 [Gammaproteobacteria bacterium]|nr:hypothetical protein [Gammaproteobacteria bacterium]
MSASNRLFKLPRVKKEESSLVCDLTIQIKIAKMILENTITDWPTVALYLSNSRFYSWPKSSFQYTIASDLAYLVEDVSDIEKNGAIIGTQSSSPASLRRILNEKEDCIKINCQMLLPHLDHKILLKKLDLWQKDHAILTSESEDEFNEDIDDIELYEPEEHPRQFVRYIIK